MAPDDCLLICGSVREDELDTVLRLYVGVRAVMPRARLLLALRHLQHVPEAERMAVSTGLNAQRVSTLVGSPTSAEVFVLDTHGDLSALYAAGDVALLGGTFAPHGGHNPNEPARYGVPVVTGPYTANIEADLALLAAADLAYRMETLDDLPALAISLTDLDRAQACRRLAELLAERPHPADRLAQVVAEGLNHGTG
jgi:3-deoxy-D-manno-octulosonic-acid transferase